MAQRKQFLLRIDPELWAELEAWAADELRSINGQIEYILREAVKRRKRLREKGDSDERPPLGEASGSTA
ncbi:MAG: hypothetical protein N3B14_03735 [Thermoleophilia bacterium]|nr:hypothetical protein [Thermoleophilia bacterium]